MAVRVGVVVVLLTDPLCLKGKRVSDLCGWSSRTVLLSTTLDPMLLHRVDRCSGGSQL